MIFLNDVLVWAVGCHGLEGGGIIRVAPLIVFGDRKRNRRVKHRIDVVYERNLSDNSTEGLWTLVHHCPHKETASTSSASNYAIWVRPTLTDKVVPATAKIGKRILLKFQTTLFVPVASQFAAPANVSNRENYSSVK